MSDSIVDTLARTLWGEARGCGESGMRNVASVILNRAAHPRWWGRDVAGVCTAPWQFACWNEGDPNLEKTRSVTEDDPQFRTALEIATLAMAGQLQDATGGADSYYAASMRDPPSWASRGRETLRDGWHVFMRLEIPAPPEKPGDRPDPAAPAVSTHAVAGTADELNQRELDRIEADRQRGDGA